MLVFYFQILTESHLEVSESLFGAEVRRLVLRSFTEEFGTLDLGGFR